MSKTSDLIKKSHAKRGAPGTLKRKVKGKMTLAKARALKNKPGATTMDKKQANFFINMHSESVQPHPDVVKAYKKTLDADSKHAEHGTTITKRNVTRTSNTLSKKIKQHHPDLDMQGNIKLRTQLQNMHEDAAAVNTGVIPNPATTAQGPKFKTKTVTDRRRRKDKLPVLLKRFRRFVQDG